MALVLFSALSLQRVANDLGRIRKGDGPIGRSKLVASGSLCLRGPISSRSAWWAPYEASPNRWSPRTKPKRGSLASNVGHSSRSAGLEPSPASPPSAKAGRLELSIDSPVPCSFRVTPSPNPSEFKEGHSLHRPHPRSAPESPRVRWAGDP